MNLELLPLHVGDTEDRRVLGAFQFVDAITQLPVAGAFKVEALRATLVGTPSDHVVPLHARSVRIQQSPKGPYVLVDAPFFGAYASEFGNPQRPAELPTGSLRLVFGVGDPGAGYLPQQFSVDLPRSLNPKDADSVFKPQVIPLFRSTGAATQDGWTILRVQMTRSGANAATPIPGAVIRVYRTPRVADDTPIGEGMTDWRGRVSGEALVPVTSLQRFWPGEGDNVVESEQAIEFEAARDSGFTGAAGQLPNAAALRKQAAVTGLQVVSPAAPFKIRAGKSYTVHLTIP